MTVNRAECEAPTTDPLRACLAAARGAPPRRPAAPLGQRQHGCDCGRLPAAGCQGNFVEEGACRSGETSHLRPATVAPGRVRGAGRRGKKAYAIGLCSERVAHAAAADRASAGGTVLRTFGCTAGGGDSLWLISAHFSSRVRVLQLDPAASLATRMASCRIVLLRVAFIVVVRLIPRARHRRWNHPLDS